MVSLFLVRSPVGEKPQHPGHIVYQGVDFYGAWAVRLVKEPLSMIQTGGLVNEN